MPFHLDSVTLKTFIAIAETGTFSGAGESVGRTQSAVSLQVKKLEEALDCALFERGTRKAKLTEQGEIFLGYARRIIDLQWEVYSRIKEPDVEGVLRLGTPEDFATHYLPEVLGSFRKHHPRVLLNVACDLTINLLRAYERGEFDLVIVKADARATKSGIKFWREPLVWAAAAGYRQGNPLSLVLAPQPCIYRARALDALDRAKIPWHLSYTSPSLAGALAAVRAGLGVTVLPANMVPEGIVTLRSKKLPPLPDAEIALLKRPGLPRAAEMLASHIIHNIEARA